MSIEHAKTAGNTPDPSTPFVNSSCLELLLIEIVPMAFRVSNELSNSKKDRDTEKDEDEQSDTVQRKLEALGYRVGQGLVER